MGELQTEELAWRKMGLREVAQHIGTPVCWLSVAYTKIACKYRQNPSNQLKSYYIEEDDLFKKIVANGIDGRSEKLAAHKNLLAV